MGIGGVQRAPSLTSIAPPIRPTSLLFQGPCHSRKGEAPPGKLPRAWKFGSFLQYADETLFPRQARCNGGPMKLRAVFSLVLVLAGPAAADSFPPITEKERALTAVAGEPNAPAVV